MNEVRVDRLVFELEDSDSDQERDERKTTSVSNLSIRQNSKCSDEIRTLKEKFSECSKQLYIRLGIKHVIPFLILLLYSVAGGAAFYYIESVNEEKRLLQRAEILTYARRQLQERVWELHVENFTRNRVLQYAAEALEWYENYTSINMQTDIQWDLWGAIFYCGTIYTTIGYGNIAPVTIGGRILTMIYSAFGIPLILFILNDMGEVIGKGAYRIWSFINRKAKYEESYKMQQARVKRNVSFTDAGSVTGIDATSTVHKLPMSVAFGITLGWMLACSAIFSLWENWDYFTAFYFFFISLTTIGLGDIVPRHHHYLMLNFGLVVLGLSLVSMCIQVVQAKVEYIAQQLLHKISKRYQTAQCDGESLTTMPAEELENTLNQIQQPTWLKALLSSKKKEKIISEYKKQTKMRARSSQTENYNYSVGVQTDDTIDWRKQYERELVNVQNLVQQLEQIYDNNEKRLSLQNFPESGQLDDTTACKNHKDTKRKLSFKGSVKKLYTDNSVASPKPATKTKSTRFANYVSQVFKSPRKKAAAMAVGGDLNPSPVLNKNVTITFNDGEVLEPNLSTDTDFQINASDDHSRPPSPEMADNVFSDNKKPTEIKRLSRQMTLQLPSTTVDKKHLIQIESLPQIHYSSKKNTDLHIQSPKEGIPANGSNKFLIRHNTTPAQQLQPKSPQIKNSLNENKKMYTVDEINKLLKNFELDNEIKSNNNISPGYDNKLSDNNIESFYANKNQSFDFADDDFSANLVPRTDLPEIHRIERQPVKKLEQIKLPQSQIRRLSLLTDQEDNSSFSRVPYALDDCKVLFAEIKHKINDCQHILSEQRLSSTLNTPIHAFKSLCDRPLTLRHSRHGFGGGDLLRREIGTQPFNGRR